MKICMLSDYTGIRDEGLRNIAFYLQRELSRRHKILHVTVWGLLSWNSWTRIKKFDPHIIHFIPGPTIKSFLMVKTLKAFCPRAKSVMSATHPALTFISKWLVPCLKPDILLIQSSKSKDMFTRLGCRLHFFPNGVDTSRFAPVNDETKRKLKKKHHLDENKPLVLHVGSITRRRNLLVFNELKRKNDIQILIVGNLSVPAELAVQLSLLKTGCQVIRAYIKNIEEIYTMADCYVFPTLDPTGSVELPLSVMEAMACNLPVITTRFGALPRFFKEGEGLFYADNTEDFTDILHKVLKGDIEVMTREKVLPFSWESVTYRLEQIYNELLGKPV